MSAGNDLEVGVTVRNTGTRYGKEVVQAYLAGPGAEPDQGRPPRVLTAFAVVRAAPGETVRATLTDPGRAFARYDEAARAWVWPPGEFSVRIGRSSADLRLSVPVRSLFDPNGPAVTGRETRPVPAS